MSDPNSTYLKLKEFGYAGLFSSRDEVNEAFQYAVDIGDSLGNRQAVLTAVFVYVNTLLEALDANGQLRPLAEQNPEESSDA